MAGSLQYVAFDEPFEFGSLSSDATYVTPCHWTADQIAEDAVRHVALLRTVFPDVIVGDIEVIPATFAAPDWLLRTISGDSEYVFPSLLDPSRPLHGAALGGALQSMDASEI